MIKVSSPWNTLLTAEDLKAHYALVDTIDPSFSAAQRKFYESRTRSELSALKSQAWNCNDGAAYQMASSYLDLEARRALALSMNTGGLSHDRGNRR